MNASASPSDTDRIERSVLIHAPRARVWRALSNAEEFGSWFGVDLKGQTFAPGGGTRLTVVESGFDQVPPHRRLEAFRMNSGGWDGQMENIVCHVGR